VADVPLGGTASRFDTLSLDPLRGRLYVAHLGDGLVIDVDLRRRTVVGRIAAPGVHGVLAVPELNRVFASATSVHELLTIDERTDSIIARARAGAYPDGIAYDPAAHELFVSDEQGGVEAVVDARTGQRTATVPLGGAAGNVQYDPVSDQILVAVQGRNELAIIDPRLHRVVRRVSLAGCAHDHGLLLDPPRRLAFVACDGNSRLLLFDLRTLTVEDSQPVGRIPDVLAFDPGLRRLYVAAETGTLTVFSEQHASLRKLSQAFLAPGAHSLTVDPRTHLVYIPLAHSGPQPLLRIMLPTGPTSGSATTGAGLSVPRPASAGPWQAIGNGSASGARPVARAAGIVANPKKMAFAIATSPPQKVNVFWTVLCNDNVGDRERSTSGSLTARAPLLRYPRLPKQFPNGPCTLYVTATLSSSGTALVRIYAY
jgi:hypothetical protein